MKLLLTAAAGLLLSHAALAQDHRAKPHLVMHRSVEGMPRGSMGQAGAGFCMASCSEPPASVAQQLQIS